MSFRVCLIVRRPDALFSPPPLVSKWRGLRGLAGRSPSPRRPSPSTGPAGWTSETGRHGGRRFGSTFLIVFHIRFFIKKRSNFRIFVKWARGVGRGLPSSGQGLVLLALHAELVEDVAHGLQARVELRRRPARHELLRRLGKHFITIR